MMLGEVPGGCVLKVRSRPRTTQGRPRCVRSVSTKCRTRKQSSTSLTGDGEMSDVDNMSDKSPYSREDFRITGAGRRRKSSGLSSHVPVRFSPEAIQAVKRLADEDGLTVSSWIRSLVGRELERRVPARTGRSVDIPSVLFSGVRESSTTRPSWSGDALLAGSL
jgi:hypothetical protein